MFPAGPTRLDPNGSAGFHSGRFSSSCSSRTTTRFWVRKLSCFVSTPVSRKNIQVSRVFPSEPEPEPSAALTTPLCSDRCQVLVGLVRPWQHLRRASQLTRVHWILMVFKLVSAGFRVQFLRVTRTRADTDHCRQRAKHQAEFCQVSMATAEPEDSAGEEVRNTSGFSLFTDQQQQTVPCRAPPPAGRSSSLQLPLSSDKNIFSSSFTEPPKASGVLFKVNKSDLFSFFLHQLEAFY